MLEKQKRQVAVIDYGMGNLFSVKNACNAVGLNVIITSSKKDILASDAIILPGVGAFENAIRTLYRLDLVNILRDMSYSGKPFVGICLGAQLMMTKSYEFGVHKGLGFIEGEVVPFDIPTEGSLRLKIPHVGWNRIFYPEKMKPKDDLQGEISPWRDTLLNNLTEGEFMYFVHSYYIQPLDNGIVISLSRYGQFEFCSAWRSGNLYAFQFHPERSGLSGLKIYHNLALMLNDKC